jgi:putative hemolysin
MELLIILLLILLNGVFSMSEIAMVSARKSRLESASKRGDHQARVALETINHPNRFLSTVQIGITLIGLLTGIFSGENITEDFESFFLRTNLPESYAHVLAVTVVLLLITFLSLVFGELVPKRIGLNNPEGIAKSVAIPMKWLTTLTSPFVWLLTITTDGIIRLFRITPSSDDKVTEEEIKAIIQEGTEAGAVAEIEQDIVERVFNLGDRTVASLMTHRSDIVYLREDFSAKEIRQAVSREMHSIYPVYKHDKDNLVGVVFLKSIFAHIEEPGFSLSGYIEEAKYLPEHSNAYDALLKFKTSKCHYSLVTDEFGHLQGMITMNDLLEALVGDVSVFHAEEFTFVEREDGSWLIDGQYPLADFLSKFDLDNLIAAYPYNTIGGLILQELKSIPHAGQKLVWRQFEIEIVDMDRARIDKVLVKMTA